eukprot:2802384-Pyramimonas_sp.AAC.1
MFGHRPFAGTGGAANRRRTRFDGKCVCECPIHDWKVPPPLLSALQLMTVSAVKTRRARGGAKDGPWLPELGCDSASSPGGRPRP